ncbi:hypothetical protein EON65_16165 [archaeon]|nr:MAG: hypothetical protein EON65_16165 [archaeon]
MDNVDTEEVVSALDNRDFDIYDALTVDGKLLVQKEQYESVSASRYDSVHDRLIFTTSVLIKGDNSQHVRTATALDVIQKLQHDQMRKKPQHLAPIPSSSSSIKPNKPKPYRIDKELVIPSEHGEEMSLSLDEAEKYFGEDARKKFFDQYRLMSQNAHIIAPNGLSAKYASESRIGTANTSDSTITVDCRTNLEEQSIISSLAGDAFLMQSSIAESAGSVMSAMQLLSDEFYQELQSISSNKKIKFDVDKEILGTQSFGTYNKYKDFDSHSLSSKKSSQVSTITQRTKVSMFSDEHTRRRARMEMKHSIYDSMASLNELNKTIPASPRTRYLAGCIREGIQPLSNLIVRRNVTTTLDLSHYSMGDKMGRVLAECLGDLPCLESINLNDNNLTDDSLQYLIEAIISIPSVHELDLSRNKIDGQSSEALAGYVSRADCPLKKLVLQVADVDDGECDHFVQCLCSNEQLLELDLSSNLLGTTETKAIEEGGRTGGEALADFIQSKSCRLQVLKLGWNSIRGNSAASLAKAVAFNNTITFLDLNNNGLGYQAGELLGDAIMENRTLRTLLVSGNNLTTTACICICIGIVQNFALNRVEMNENPIGEVGVRMIMQVSMSLGSRVSLQAKNCNTIVTDGRCWYNPSNPCRSYSLKLDRPFDRAVAFHLLHIVATHNSYIFQTSTYELEKGNPQPLKLVQGIAKDREVSFDEDQKKNLAGLRLVVQAASNTQLANELFFEADADHSGRLDKDELQEVLGKIGFVIEEDRLHDIMAVFDVDGAGTIDLQEFMSLLKSQQREAMLRVKDLTEYPIMTLSGDPSNKVYVPPRKGVLHLKLVDGFVQKKKFYTMSATDQKYAYNMAKGLGDVTMVTEAVKHSKVRFDEAYSMYKSVYKEIRDKAGTLLKVVPLMTNPSDSRQLVSKVTNDNRVEVARIKMAFGVTFRPMLGSYNGYYCLDLSKELHRLCLQRLLLESQTQAAKRGAASIIAIGKVGDTSQHGNWSCFRNEVLNGKAVVITPELVTPMPQTGTLEFDFSTTARPTGSELRLSDKRLCKALHNICLLTPEKSDSAMRTLADWRRKAHEMTQDKKMYMPMYAFDVPKALEIGRYSDDFYERVEDRRMLMRAGLKKEEIGLHMVNNDDNHGANTAATVKGDDKSTADNTDGSIGDIGDDSSFAANLKTNDNTDSESEGEEDGDSISYISPQKMLELRQKRIADQLKRLQKLLSSSSISKQAKAKRLLDVIEETFNLLWIQARHLALIVTLFRSLLGYATRCKFFGSYCADIVVALFSRVVDLHNFEVVWEVLDAADCSAVLCRIGMLNIFNPMKPEMSLELKMDRREERVVAKIIVYLSVVEPGLNLTFKQFMWKRELDPIPGWDVTEPWMTEQGMSAHGYFAFTYYSGEGKNKCGCVPDIYLRRALTGLVLIDENEIVAEDESMPEALINTTAIHYERNKDLWINYLVIDKYV